MAVLKDWEGITRECPLCGAKAYLMEDCPACEGTGKVAKYSPCRRSALVAPDPDCPYCEGRGYALTCPECIGEGIVGGVICPKCKGEGVTPLVGSEGVTGGG